MTDTAGSSRLPGTAESAGSADPPPPADAKQALERLIEGNARFVQQNTRHAHESADWRQQLVEGQKPFATILGCSDSRVPPELVFDQGFGDLFVVRVAGNVIATDVVGTLEYAVKHLGIRLVIVMGHQGCGAVTAALAALEIPSSEPPGLTSLLQMIAPGLPNDLPADPKERLNVAVEANVRWSMKQLRTMKETRPAIEDHRAMLVGAVYELETGTVRFLND